MEVGQFVRVDRTQFSILVKRFRYTEDMIFFCGGGGGSNVSFVNYFAVVLKKKKKSGLERNTFKDGRFP